MKNISCAYHHLPIPGGGYVTGFMFHQKAPNILYARTDIGGVYRYEYKEQRWKSLMEHVKQEDLSESFPIAIALDSNKPERLWIACGENKPNSGVLALSNDYGEHFTYEKIPARVHGNLNGRGTGSRLIVDVRDSSRLYFASQENGLLRSDDLGKTWESLDVNGEQYMTMIWQSPNGKTLVVGTAGVTTSYIDELTRQCRRGMSLYVSYDEGQHFKVLDQPISRGISDSRLPGYVAQRYDYDGKYLYITLSQTGQYSYVVENGYSCDSGDALGGRVIRYSLDEAEHITGYEDITPIHSEDIRKEILLEKQARTKKEEDRHQYLEAKQVNENKDVLKDQVNDKERISTSGQNIEPKNKVIQVGLEEKYQLNQGFSGISSCNKVPGLLVCSTICRKTKGKDTDVVYLSYDYGTNWEVILYDLSIGNLTFKAAYMKPQYNGNQSILHWLSDVKINPFNPEEMWFNSGTGVFKSEKLMSEERSFHDQCDGIEETVHLNLYSPPAGKVQLIDILGDLGGFAFTDLDKPCENSFADEEGNRYITCINADYSDVYPECVIVTPRGNWTGKTKGGLILSEDQCKTFRRLEMPYGITDQIDERLREIEKPNVNSGWVALSPDCKHIVWSIADNWMELPMSLVVYSEDGGKNFKKSQIYDRDGKLLEEGCLKVFSDRKVNHLMYGFGSESDFYISHDGGATFKAYEVPETFPKVHFGLIDCANPVEVRADAGKSGIFYMALGEHGLWKMTYREEEDCLTLCKLSKEEDVVNHLGLGVLRVDGDYLKEDKALYISGTIEGVYGFYRSLDDGKNWTRLNTEKQMFGDINSIEGDSRCFGRFFIATGSVGVLYGEPID
ncbi:MAG: endoglucanase [Cellulosilyticum sp.]|nr:endoglucanase [Cellulosilyticum sp.]